MRMLMKVGRGTGFGQMGQAQWGARLASKVKLPYSPAMTSLKLTSKGQITIRKEVISHLGLKAGDKIDVEMLPGGAVMLRAAPRGDIRDAFGMLERADGPKLSLEEIQDSIANGWAGRT
jgi:antitoxin PrlF